MRCSSQKAYGDRYVEEHLPDRAPYRDLHMTLTLRSDRYFILEREFYPEAVQESKKVDLHVMLTEKGPYRHRDNELVLQVKDLKVEPQNRPAIPLCRRGLSTTLAWAYTKASGITYLSIA